MIHCSATRRWKWHCQYQCKWIFREQMLVAVCQGSAGRTQWEVKADIPNSLGSLTQIPRTVLMELTQPPNSLLFWFWSCFLQERNKTIKRLYNENLLFQFYLYIKTKCACLKPLKSLISKGLGGGRAIKRSLNTADTLTITNHLLQFSSVCNH